MGLLQGEKKIASRKMEVDERTTWEEFFEALITRQFENVARSVVGSELRSYALGWLRKVALELHAELAEEMSRVRADTKADCSVRYMHPKGTNSMLAVACVASEAAAAAGGGWEQSDAERMTFEVVFAPSEATVFFVGSNVHDLKHAYHVMRISVETMRPIPWQRGVHELSAAVPGFKLCSALSYLYRAHSLCSINKLHPRLRRTLIPGDTCVSSQHWPDAEDEQEPWLPSQDVADVDSNSDAGRVALNAGQMEALRGITGAVTLVQGPPGTGKSSFILEAFLQRMPSDARMLACTATNKVIAADML